MHLVGGVRRRAAVAICHACRLVQLALHRVDIPRNAEIAHANLQLAVLLVDREPDLALDPGRIGADDRILRGLRDEVFQFSRRERADRQLLERRAEESAHTGQVLLLVAECQLELHAIPRRRRCDVRIPSVATRLC
jgi:hypothetical protein